MKKDTKDEITANICFVGSSAAVLKPGPEVELLKSALKKCSFIRDVSFIEVEHEYELDNCTVLTEKVPLIHADPHATLVVQEFS